MAQPLQSPHRRDSHRGPYRDCTHPDCLIYRERYRKRWAYERAHGHLRKVRADRARLHVQTLSGQGWSLRAIAAASGTSPSVISRLRRGDQEWMQVDVARRILAITPASIPSLASASTTEPFVWRVGTTRRLQALLYMGWSHAEISRRGGFNSANLLHQQGRWVTRSTHDKVVAVFDELAMRRGGSAKAATYARQRGYAPPLAWDDIDHDEMPADTSYLAS